MKKKVNFLLSFALVLGLTITSSAFADPNETESNQETQKIQETQGGQEYFTDGDTSTDSSVGILSQTYLNQDVTAYTASRYYPDGSTRLTHSGKAPALGMVAVRATNGRPHLPFGTGIVGLTTYIDGQAYSFFTVEDTGIAATQSYYALDVWYGFCRAAAYTGSGATPLGCNKSDDKYQQALQFGNQTWTYTTN